MKLTVEGEAKEIADFVGALQNPLNVKVMCSPKEIINESLEDLLRENTHDTSEGESYLRE